MLKKNAQKLIKLIQSYRWVKWGDGKVLRPILTADILPSSTTTTSGEFRLEGTGEGTGVIRGGVALLEDTTTPALFMATMVVALKASVVLFSGWKSITRSLGAYIMHRTAYPEPRTATQNTKVRVEPVLS